MCSKSNGEVNVGGFVSLKYSAPPLSTVVYFPLDFSPFRESEHMLWTCLFILKWITEILGAKMALNRHLYRNQNG